jgi:alcohol dehydrogenase, propanol-preferring
MAGHMAIQYSNALGYKTLAVDVKDKQLEFAKSVGATATLNTRSVKSVKEEVDRITGTRGCHASLTTSGVGAVYKTAFEITRSHGRVVAIGLSRGHLPLTPDDIILDCKEYRSQFVLLNGRLVGTLAPGQKEINECVKFSFEHNIFGHVTERKLEDL